LNFESSIPSSLAAVRFSFALNFRFYFCEIFSLICLTNNFPVIWFSFL